MASVTSASYIDQVRRLLHDAAGAFYTAEEILVWVNEARHILAHQTGCVRAKVNFNLVADQAEYPFYTFFITGNLIAVAFEVHNIILNYSQNTKYPLRYYPYTEILRSPMAQYVAPGTPNAYTVYNDAQAAKRIIVYPTPSQNFNDCIADCIFDVDDLGTTIGVDDEERLLSFMWSQCIQYYVAYLAKLKDQRRSEANDFLEDYANACIRAYSADMNSRIVGQ